MEKLKVLELFGGIGACSKALKNIGVDYEIVDYVEIDKYAVKSFNAIFGTNFEPQDICEWNKQIDVDLIMHGSPCQDFSLAGKQAGGDEGSGTRSSLMYETIRIVEKLKPKYVIWENVKNLLSKKHRHNFDAYLETMEKLGYANYYQVLNAKDYGIPQNRERVFTISILSGCDYQFPNGNKNDNQIKRLFNFSARQDCRVVYDQDGLCPTLVAGMGEGGGKVPMFIENGFEFPPKQELKLKLKDMLEDEVDGKYYLSDELIKNIKYNKEIKTNEVVRKYGVFDDNKSKHQAGSVYDENGLSPTLDTMQGGWRQPCIEIKNATKKGYQEATEGDSVNLSYPKSKIRRGRVGKQVSQTIQCNDAMGVVLKSKCKRLKKLVEKTEFEKGKVLNMDLYNQTTNENISQCLTEPHHNSQRLYDGLRIRKLTPKECWRLMGFNDEDFEKAEKVNSNTQLYKQAGNSIVVNVLMAIFKELLESKGD